jgi:hypothetical protein
VQGKHQDNQQKNLAPGGLGRGDQRWLRRLHREGSLETRISLGIMKGLARRHFSLTINRLYVAMVALVNRIGSGFPFPLPGQLIDELKPDRSA